MKKKILFICLGNICRSVTAEEILRVKASEAGIEVEIDSAGLIDYHEGELADERMRRVASRHGYHLIHRSRPIKPHDFQYYDLIVGMDGNNIRRLQRLAPSTAYQKKIVLAVDFLSRHNATSVPDPYYGSEKDFEWVVELLEDVAEGIIAQFLQ